MDQINFWIGIIATIAFAVTGVLAIADRGVDLFGVLVLGVITAIGCILVDYSNIYLGGFGRMHSYLCSGIFFYTTADLSLDALYRWTWCSLVWHSGCR
jgi:hypothetical protein